MKSLCIILRPHRISNMCIKEPIQNTVQLDNEMIRRPTTKGAEKEKLQ